LLSSSAPGVHYGERSVGVVLFEQRLEARVIAKGVPLLLLLQGVQFQAASGRNLLQPLERPVVFTEARENERKSLTEASLSLGDLARTWIFEF
jgi:hypothetical protein